MKKKVLLVFAGCVLAYFGWTTLQAQASLPNGLPGNAYLTTITDATTGAFSSRSVITLHADHSMTAIDSGQGGPGVQFSSQMGAWRTSPGAGVVARTLDFSFPNAGIARVDYNFTTLTNDQAAGTITLTVFPIDADPQGSGGTVVGTFNFTGQHITVP
ncbi:MAG TPA: hypothetical protein VKH81_10520 [Candidatus Angelobacter sp.]|nr:hypothetical protein [Candidatus Angelobacter sp.]